MLNNLFKEFRRALLGGSFSYKTDAIVVLDFFDHAGTESIEIKATNWENIARTRYAAEIWRRCGGRPFFFLNGLSAALPYLKQMALKEGIPPDKIRLLDNGAIGIGNSLTQFDLVANDLFLPDESIFTFVSTSYHIPRLERIAAMRLPHRFKYGITGVPFSDFSYDMAVILGEIKRIFDYSEKGDIAKYPRK